MDSTATPGDAVAAILQQWQRERPDLDASPMGIIGRLGRCTALLRGRLDETFARFGLSSWEFDVLATLRRAGSPYCLAPTALFRTLMITSGTMTRQLQQLEGRGLIGRLPNPDDARSQLVQLSAAGLALIDEAVAAHVANEHAILAPLAAAERAQLEQGLIRLLALLETPGD
ncbi:MarR family winged helix-turn-helix transcriptional regulator [Vogesella sp. LIG4]|uniref:MarR family winged helix-turn-helix transcriptional regulator n=1 Tax=Vogesella sp. LIG4 TaxID=1192162 RepID=UPI00081FE801|nr:MarR family transcriptional regulator [Vogesella sp. LIG4]SCK12336.1 DNA-binding transcriptional regulator, MarR family [Vogesella sp. LIG4]